jgi:uncharacterized protein
MALAARSWRAVPVRGRGLARVATLALGLALAAVALFAGAQELVPVPKLERRVTDLTGTLTPEQIATLDQRLAAFESSKGSQIAVLMVPTTKPEAIEQYAIRVAEAWKVGRAKVDDGLVLVIAKNDQRLRIEVGYGLEGVIPDAIAKRVIRETIAPHFLTGDFYGGIAAGTDQLVRLIEGEQLPPPRASPQQRGPQGAEAFETYLVLLLVFTVIVGGILTRILGRFLGATATGGIAGFLALAIAGTLIAAIGAGVLAFVFSMLFGGTGGTIARGRRGGSWGGPVGGWGGGSWGGGGGGWSGGGWSGGGGGFGGGGASGSWGD